MIYYNTSSGCISLVHGGGTFIAIVRIIRNKIINTEQDSHTDIMRLDQRWVHLFSLFNLSNCNLYNINYDVLCESVECCKLNAFSSDDEKTREVEWTSRTRYDYNNTGPRATFTAATITKNQIGGLTFLFFVWTATWK